MPTQVPAQGDGSVGALINELFPSITWVRSLGAHRPITRLASSFVTVADGILPSHDKFTPTKHLTPPPHHSSRRTAAHTDTETPLQ